MLVISTLSKEHLVKMSKKCSHRESAPFYYAKKIGYLLIVKKLAIDSKVDYNQPMLNKEYLNIK